MLLDIKLGDRQLRPSERQQLIAACGAGGLAVGLATDSGWLKFGGALALAGVAWSVYQEASLFRQPAEMNAHFQGRVSAMAPVGPPAVLAGVHQSAQRVARRIAAGRAVGGPR